MAIEIVSTGDERCDVCAGDPERRKPPPGERHSVRETVSTMCEVCYEDFRRDVWVGQQIAFRQPPDDPSKN